MCPCLLHPAPGSKKTSLCGCGGGFFFLVYGNLESSHALPANGRREGRDDLANLATYRLFVFLAEFLLTVDWRGRGAKGDPLGRLDPSKQFHTTFNRAGSANKATKATELSTSTEEGWVGITIRSKPSVIFLRVAGSAGGKSASVKKGSPSPAIKPVS